MSVLAKTGNDNNNNSELQRNSMRQIKQNMPKIRIGQKCDYKNDFILGTTQAAPLNNQRGV